MCFQRFLRVLAAACGLWLGAAANAQRIYGPPFVAPPLGVSVATYGADPTGVVDQSGASGPFARAWNVLASKPQGGMLYVPQGRYLFTTQLHLYSAVPISIIAAPGTILDRTGDTTIESTLILTGTTNASVPQLLEAGTGSSTGQFMSADTLIGTHTITTMLSAAAGDVLLLSTVGVTVFTATIAGFNTAHGELNEVQAFSAGSPNTITLENASMEAYTAVNTTVFDLGNLPRFTVENLEFDCAGNNSGGFGQTGVYVQYCRNPQINGCKFQGCSGSGVQLSWCYGGAVSNCYAHQVYTQGDGNGTGYCVDLNSCRGVHIGPGNTFIDARATITLVGTDCPCDFTEIEGNYLHAKSTAALGVFDDHSCARNTSIHNNTLIGGSQIGAGNVTFQNNIVWLDGQNGVYAHPDQTWDYLTITGNTFYGAAGTVGTTDAIRIAPASGYTAGYSHVNIDNNTAVNPNTGIHILGVTGSTLNITRLSTSSDKFSGCVANGILFSGAAGTVNIGRWEAAGGYYSAGATASSTVSVASITFTTEVRWNNVVFVRTNASNTSNHTVDMSGLTDWTVIGCQFDGPATNTPSVVSCSGHAKVSNCVFRGTTGGGGLTLTAGDISTGANTWATGNPAFTGTVNNLSTISATFDGQGSAITAGTDSPPLYVPYDCLIVQTVIQATGGTPTGVVDVRAVAGTGIPTSGNSLGANPTLANPQAETSLAGVKIAAGSTVVVHWVSGDATRASVSLQVWKMK